MPYRHSHYYVGFVLAVIMLGFWASYWSIAASVRNAFHVHAISAMAWLGLLIVQNLSIQRRHNALHKRMGMASLVLFPFLILGLVMIMDVAGQRYAAQESAFTMHNGPSFGIGTGIAIAAYLTLFYQALKNRRRVKLHAGYMLATPLILFESPFSRVMEAYLPWMNVIGSDDIHIVQDTIAISDGLVALFALVLYSRDRRNGAPWLVAAGFCLFQAVVMWFGPYIPLMGTLFGAYATIPLPVTAAAGMAAGILAGWLGWKAGAAPVRSAATVAAA
ncbi:hypothetical protein B0I00_2349 [Novosphingobium kunmingense]|uniref:Uncharacterized protein n=1 Tax=Novosphingobium kunmingense TaxID=1211806 RepID=A0A2N0H725_9SPHN|nr:hypothetical protein [Novosphingobium kunmingense]PKB14749.1 hypothetical protein B0I00_2349 [Novosphingobium kunmingense]